MKLAYITPCFYPTEQPCHMLIKSARYFNIPLELYGVGEPGGDWSYMCVERLLPELHRLRDEGYSHAMYVDGRDSLFAAGESDIIAAYESFGAPYCLMSTEDQCYPFGQLARYFDRIHHGRYPNAGQYMGEITWFIHRWRMLCEHYSKLGANWQGWVLDAIVNGDLYGLVTDPYQLLFGRLTVHCNGGYMDPETGRDDRLQVEWKRILDATPESW